MVKEVIVMENLFDKIRLLLEEEHDQERLKEAFLDLHPYDIASILPLLTPQERQDIYEILTYEEIADIFEYIDNNELVISFLDEMSKKEGALIIDEMEPDDAADILKDDGASKYLDLIDEEQKDDVIYLMSHDEDTAGSIMTTNYIELSQNDDVKIAMKKLFQNASESEMIDILYVVEDERLIGTLTLHDLIVARSPKLVGEIMDTNLIYCEVSDDIILASKKIHNYGLYALPILDNGIMKGIITMDDAVDTLEEEAVEDYEKLAGVSDIDENLSFIQNIKKRLPWLLILLVLSFIVSFVESGFDHVISAVTVLVFFQTLILDMSGNSGTQSLAVTVRGVSNNQFGDAQSSLKRIFKEMKIGLLNGFLMCLMAFVSSMIFLSIKNVDGSIYISLVIGISMGLALLSSGVIGATIPILLSKLKIDPAVASGPFITTISDIVAILIYFGLASAILL